MVREVVMLPEMVTAGTEALDESQGQTKEALVIAVYLSMRAIEEAAYLRAASELVH